jgi:phosphohistidine phosphatase SixA
LRPWPSRARCAGEEPTLLEFALLSTAGALTLALLSFAREAHSDEGQLPVTLYAVRHAEKERGTSDPGLTEAGLRRADALVEVLGEIEFSAIFSSDYRRCQETIAPLAQRRGLEPTVIEAADPHGQLAALHALPPGSTALLCGHANTVPAMIAALGGELTGLQFGMIRESIYDRLFIVTYAAGSEASTEETRVDVQRYGESTGE